MEAPNGPITPVPMELQPGKGNVCIRAGGNPVEEEEMQADED